MSYYWPIGLIVVSNVVYQICAKSVPEGANPFASLVITYLISAAFSLIMFCLTRNGATLGEAFRRLNVSSVILGIALVGLEVGSIYLYKAGWNVNTGFVVHSAIVAVCLLIVGYFLYAEKITPSKLAGTAICMLGLWFINK